MKRKYTVNKLNDEQRKIIKNYINRNLDGTYTSFKLEIGDRVNCSDTRFYQIRREILGGKGIKSTKRGRHSRTPLYMTLWSCPAEECSEETKKVLSDFIQNLNNIRNARFQIVELKEPNVIEIREMST